MALSRAQLGVRDTYAGLDFDGIGSVTIGRQLVASYNYVDWPHSNPGLGYVFDWNNDIGVSYQDRADNVLRFDSATWKGVNFQATVSGMEGGLDQAVLSAGVAYSHSIFKIHAAIYSRGKYEINESEVDKYIFDDNGNTILNPDYIEGGKLLTKYANRYGLIGGSLHFDDLTFTAAYKAMQVDTATDKSTQNAFSTTVKYLLNNKVEFKAGYAMTTDAEIDGVTKHNSGDQAITGRIGYLLPSTFLYTEVRNYKMNGGTKRFNQVNLGIKYFL